MPRYRFSWDNVPDALKRKLCTQLSLEGTPDDALRATYGARPKAVFVQDAWPILLAEWLPRDTANRKWIVEQLRERSLGRADIDTRSSKGQLDYLATCKNAPTLREVVLAAFHALGEPPEATVVAVPGPSNLGSATNTAATPAEATPVPPPTDDTSPHSLGDWTKGVLAEHLGVESVFVDPDGDIPIRNGTSMTYVRVIEEQPTRVRFFAYLVRGISKKPELYETANEISLSVVFAKALVVEEGTAILLLAEIPGETLSPGELIGTLGLVTNAADYFDSMIQERFGGATSLAEEGEHVDV